MFSKKVEEFDELKQNLSMKEREVNSLQVERNNLQDYRDKYLREFEEKEDLQLKYKNMNELLES